MSIEAVAQINQKANETISRLQPRLSEIEQAIREAEEELATFPKLCCNRIMAKNSDNPTNIRGSEELEM
jgi:hypothetical protein